MIIFTPHPFLLQLTLILIDIDIDINIERLFFFGSLPLKLTHLNQTSEKPNQI